MADISELIGVTLTEIKNTQDRIEFISDCDKWAMYHIQDCCEAVYVADIIGDLQDLVGSPIVRAEENTSNQDPKDFKRGKGDYYPESMTWTFYRIGTEKGTVVIRWCGESNGYYSESVEFSGII